MTFQQNLLNSFGDEYISRYPCVSGHDFMSDGDRNTK
jgi:hypothetical protein